MYQSKDLKRITPRTQRRIRMQALSRLSVMYLTTNQLLVICHALLRGLRPGTPHCLPAPESSVECTAGRHVLQSGAANHTK
jgi:hypothetical protein